MRNVKFSEMWNLSQTMGSAGHAAASAGTTGGTLTINLPAGTVANDILIASIGLNPTMATITPPAEWTLVRRVDNANSTARSSPWTVAAFQKKHGLEQVGIVGPKTRAILNSIY